MRYLDTAFAQLEFSLKLLNYALDGKIDLDNLDAPMTFRDQSSFVVLSDKTFRTHNDFLLACENNVSICFGAAAITLDRCRKEAGINLPDPILSEIDQFVSLAFQIRCAFAHDISEPKWNITKARFARIYEFENVKVDLRIVGNKPFEYSDIGGAETLFMMKNYASKTILS